MVERYTEKAGRVIFFARHEASRVGSPYIETEHLLLRLLREDKALIFGFLRCHASVDSIRKQIERRTTIREKVSTSVDLALSSQPHARGHAEKILGQNCSFQANGCVIRVTANSEEEVSRHG
jgi:ATP-dependent Clp protease ATP-binding subunit ClpA